MNLKAKVSMLILPPTPVSSERYIGGACASEFACSQRLRMKAKALRTSATQISVSTFSSRTSLSSMPLLRLLLGLLLLLFVLNKSGTVEAATIIAPSFPFIFYGAEGLSWGTQSSRSNEREAAARRRALFLSSPSAQMRTRRREASLLVGTAALVVVVVA